MTTYYIAPTGNDTTGAGTVGNPWLTLSKAYTASTSGDTINCAAGTYTFATATMTNRIIVGAALVGGIPTTIFDGASADVAWSLGGVFSISYILFQNITRSSASPVFDTTVASSTISYSYCWFKSIKTSTSTQGKRVLIGIANVASCTVNISYCVFQDILRNGGTLGYMFGFYAQNLAAMTVTGCALSFLTSGINQMVGLVEVNSITNGTIIWKNTICQNATGATNSYNGGGGLTSTATYCDFYNITSNPTGTGVITSDPLFVDAAGGNFNLRPTSPCRDTGTLI